MTFFRNTLVSLSANPLNSQWAWPRWLVRLDRKGKTLFFFFLLFFFFNFEFARRKKNVLKGLNAWIYSSKVISKDLQTGRNMWEVMKEMVICLWAQRHLWLQINSYQYVCFWGTPRLNGILSFLFLNCPNVNVYFPFSWKEEAIYFYMEIFDLCKEKN